MALDNHYIPAFSLQNVFLDKDSGAPLSGGVLTFYKDSDGVTPKSMYQLIGTPPSYNEPTYESVGPTITLNAVGECAIGDDPFLPYFYPYDSEGNLELYYMTVESSEGTSQFAWHAIPYVAGSGTEGGGNNIENELSNPQFSTVNFGDTGTAYAITLAATTTLSVAPGWDLILTGAGTVTLTQLAPVAGTIDTNPPYALDIALSGFIGNAELRQTFSGNASLFTDGWINGFLVAKSTGSSAALSLQYGQSSGSPSGEVIVSATTTVGTYNVFRGTKELSASTNLNTAPDGYSYISLIIPNGAHITVTSLQVYGSSVEVQSSAILFDEQPIARLDDHLAHYYKPQLAYKPIPSWAIGWDFKFNPSQQYGASIGLSGLGANQARYIADQTIAFESVGNVTQYTISESTGLNITPSSATQLALIQYLDKPAALALLQDNICVRVKTNSSIATDVTANVTLYWTTNASVPTLPTVFFSTLTAGVPTTLTAGWTKVAKGNFANSSWTISNGDYASFDFSGWNEPDNAGLLTATFFAIVIGFNTVPNTGSITLEYVTLQNGDIPTPPPATNKAQTLAALQYYYERSYNPGIAAATGNAAGQMVAPMVAYTNGGNTEWGATSFSLSYKALKRVAVTPTFYAGTSGLINNVTASVYTSGAAQANANATIATWDIVFSGTLGVLLDANSATSYINFASTTAPVSSIITYQYVADARIGVV